MMMKIITQTFGHRESHFHFHYDLKTASGGVPGQNDPKMKEKSAKINQSINHHHHHHHHHYHHHPMEIL